MADDFSRPQVLECPSCGATLALPDADTFLCDYCGKRIVVPKELRPHQPALDSISSLKSQLDLEQSSRQTPDQSEISGTTVQPKRTSLVLVLAISFGLLLTGIVLFVILLLTPASKSTDNLQAIDSSKPITTLTAEAQFASLVMVFGEEGDQPGQFDDARSIAVDDEGNIFVADYTSGRINKFNPAGNFMQLIQLQPSAGNYDVYIYGLAADRLGYLYVAADGSIFKYDASTGELLLTIPDQWPEIYFDSVVVAPDGNLYSTNGMAGADDIIILSPQGDVLAHWVETIEKVNHDDPAMELALGVNHSGTVYILSPFGKKVYGYNPDGTFRASFGEEGDLPGQFDLSTGMVAITEKDYLVISDVYRVDLFDRNGTYLDRTFTIDYNLSGGSMYGMAIDATGDLYFISSGGKVLKFEMNYP